MITAELWYREALRDSQVLDKLWADFDRTSGNGPDVEKKLLEIIRLTGRLGGDWERVIQAELEVGSGRIEDVLRTGSAYKRVWVHETNARGKRAAITVTYVDTTVEPPQTDLFFVFPESHQARKEGYGAGDELIYFVDYGLNGSVAADNPFPEESYSLSAIARTIKDYVEVWDEAEA